MTKHESFELWIYDDEELSALLGSGVTARHELQVWPLSRVERLTLADGRRLIYKVQAEPTAESEFYERMTSPLLAPVRSVLIEGMPPALFMNDLGDQKLSDQGIDPTLAHQVATEICYWIGDMKGEAPCYLSIASVDEWRALVDRVVLAVSSLVQSGGFKKVTAIDVQQIAEVGASQPVLALFEGPMGLLHGDLHANNVMVTDEGYRIIDWQRPLRGPLLLDRYVLLDSLGVPVRETMGDAWHQMRTILLIDWYSQAATRWFRPGVPYYDDFIVGLAASLGSS